VKTFDWRLESRPDAHPPTTTTASQTIATGQRYRTAHLAQAPTRLVCAELVLTNERVDQRSLGTLEASVRKRRDVELIHEELEELFADLWQVPGFAGLRRGFRPQVDCFRTEEPPAVTLVVDLAGIDPEQVSIQVTERTVLVSGVRRRPELTCPVSYRQMEIEYGQFQRRVTLAEDVDPSRAEATYERGLLSVVMPLAQTPRTGRITIALGQKEAE
jgi:HSP20 family protein